MTSDGKQTPGADEIRAALQKIQASSAFAHSPQLVAFLRFVVCAVLKGETENIKSYTVAVDALGRPESFDPRTDPIVRVEAGRLRRALARYYATEGKHSAIIIELPLGSYIPSISRRKSVGGRAALAAGLRHHFRDTPRGTLVAASVVVLAVVALLGIGVAHRVNHPAPEDTAAALSDALLPIVFVAPFEVRGASAQQTNEVEALRGRLRDALARFDEIEVASEGAPASSQPATRSAYRLVGIADYHGDTIHLSLSLDDADDETVAWTQAFDLATSDLRERGKDIVRQVATQLAQPYGVIYAHELADSRADTRFRCVLDAFEFRRTFNNATRAAAEACIAQLTAAYPRFADGFALQSLNVLNRYYEGNGDPVLLEQAVALAQKAVDLKPQSARARQALLSALFARGDVGPALTEGETAVSLNHCDMIVLYSYGLHLMLADHAEQGAELMRRAAAQSPVRPALFEFGLFLAAYILRDEPDSATRARLYTSGDYPLTYLARAVIAARSGDTVAARAALEKLLAMSPRWRMEPKQRLQRYFRSPQIVDRLMADLKLAGMSTAD